MTERTNRFAGTVKKTRTEPIEPAQGQTRGAPKAERKKGRTHPDLKDSYVSTTVYIARHVHKQTKVALLDDGRDLSELVEDLLRGWLEASEA